MIWRFTILDRNNIPTVIDEPVGWDANVSEIKRDPDWHGIFFNNQGDTFEFHGPAMKLIKAENDQYGSEGNMILIMEENCGLGFEEFSRGRFNFSKYENYESYVKIPVENTSEIMDLRNRINQKVDLSTLKAFDETTDLEPYDKLPFTIALPSKGIYMQDKAEWSQEETTVFNTLTILWEGPTRTAPGAIPYFWFQIVPQIDNVVLSEFGRFSTAGAPEINILRSQLYSYGVLPEGYESVINGNMTTPPNTRRLWFDWASASPLLVNDNNQDNFDSIDKFTLDINYSFDIGIVPKYDPSAVSSIVSLYNVVVIRRKNGSFEYLAKERIMSGTSGSYDGYDPASIWKNDETHNVNFSRAFIDVKLNDGDYLFVTVVGLAYTHLSMIGADFDLFNITSKSGAVNMETMSHFKETEAKVFAVNEAISRIAESITNNKLKAYSEYFGRTDSQPYALPDDGCGGLEVITDGIRVRRQENKIPDQTSIFSQSLQDVFNGLAPIHNIGMGVEPDPLRSGFNRLRVESWDFFYNDIVIMNCTGVDLITRKTYDKDIYSTFQFGYNKWEAEEYNGLDELLTKRNYRLTLSQIKNDLIKLSTWIGSGYALEVTRRKGNENTKDWRYDKEVFVICVRRGEMTDSIEVELGNVINAVNIIEPSTLYNFRISPVRNAMRWMSRVLESYKQFDAGSKIIFTDGDGNYFANGEMEDNNCKLENTSIVENVTIDPSIYIDSNAAKPFRATERVSYEYPMSSKEYKIIAANPYGLIYFENDCDEGLGWIDTLSYKPEEGLASFNLIPAIDVDPTGCVPVAIRGDGSLPAGLINVPYSAIINLYGTGPFDLTNIVKPAWMTISVSGTTVYLSGTPTDVGILSVSFDVSNCEGTNQVSFSGSVDIGMYTCEEVAISGTPVLPDGYVNTAYNYSLDLTGDGPFELSNIIKPDWMGITIVDRRIFISGTPLANGTDVAVSFDVSNCSGSNTVSFSDTIDITTLCIPATITGTPDLPNALIGFAYNYSIDVAGTGPFTIDDIIAPDWMTVELSLNTIVFSGMPDVAGVDIPVSFSVDNCAATPVSFDDTIDVLAAGGDLLLQTNDVDNDDQEILDLVDSDTIGFEYLGAGKVTAHFTAYNDRFKGKYTTLAALELAYPTANAGDYAQVDTGAGSNVVNYNYDVEDGWVIGSAGSGATDTDGLPEGSSNLYFTTARARSAFTDTANRISITSGVIDIDSAYVGQNTITTLGTIGTGVWNGTAIGPTYGGTGLNSYAKGDLIYASAINTLAKLSLGSAGYVLTADASGVPVWAAAAGGLPSQTGNTGKFLTTNGTSASWVAVTGWSTTGNAGTDGGVTNFIGTTDNKGLLFSTNGYAGAFLASGGGLFIKAPYSGVNHIGISFGYQAAGSEFFINGGGCAAGNATTFVGGGAWISGYTLSFGTTSNRIMTLASTGVTVSALTVTGSTITVAQGVYLSGGNVKFTSTGGTAALEYAGALLWAFGIRKSATDYILKADNLGNISIGSTGAGTPLASSTLTLNSTTQGFLITRMNTSQVAAISAPAEALQAYDTTLHGIKLHNGTVWNNIVHSNISNSKVTASAPYTNDGYIEVTIGGTNYKLMTTT